MRVCVCVCEERIHLRILIDSASEVSYKKVPDDHQPSVWKGICVWKKGEKLEEKVSYGVVTEYDFQAGGGMIDGHAFQSCHLRGQLKSENILMRSVNSLFASFVFFFDISLKSISQTFDFLFICSPSFSLRSLRSAVLIFRI